MAHPPNSWLLDPVIPAAPALPRIGAQPEPQPVDPNDQFRSGTWRIEQRAKKDDSEAGSPRFATSDSEAPTVRPGALRSQKKR